jgi:hypothetical protein
MTDNEATIFLFLAVVVAAILAATACPAPDLVEPPEPDPAECEAWCWEQVEPNGWSSTDYEECRAGCGVVG